MITMANNQILLVLPIVLALTIPISTTQIFAQTGVHMVMDWIAIML